jgi:hypothetical protein
MRDVLSVILVHFILWRDFSLFQIRGPIFMRKSCPCQYATRREHELGDVGIDVKLSILALHGISGQLHFMVTSRLSDWKPNKLPV